MAICPDDYIKYTEHYRRVEENKAIYSIKPDLPINFIHPDLMVAAVTEGFKDASFVSSREALETLVGRLYQIHMHRCTSELFQKVIPALLYQSY